jgi:hypothetical protein
MPDDDRISTPRDKAVVNKEPRQPAALPPGSLKRPFFGRQGDEQRQPTEPEMRKIIDIKKKLNRGEKV